MPTTPTLRPIRTSQQWEQELLADAVERAWRGEIPSAKRVGRPLVNDGATNIPRGPNGADSILARLKRDDPSLADQVINGDVSPTQPP